jgi:hypothetical protein
MNEYLIALHLTAPRDEYRYLDVALTSKRATPITKTVFSLASEDSATDISDDLLRFLQPGDSILVTGIVNPLVFREVRETDDA